MGRIIISWVQALSRIERELFGSFLKLFIAAWNLVGLIVKNGIMG
jgi:hypothetical protein